MHVLSPNLKKKDRDYKKFRLFTREGDREKSKLKDPEYGAAWLAALKERQKGG